MDGDNGLEWCYADIEMEGFTGGDRAHGDNGGKDVILVMWVEDGRNVWIDLEKLTDPKLEPNDPTHTRPDIWNMLTQSGPEIRID